MNNFWEGYKTVFCRNCYNSSEILILIISSLETGWILASLVLLQHKCFFLSKLASNELDESRRHNWGQQLKVLEQLCGNDTVLTSGIRCLGMFWVAVLFSAFFFGLECSFFRIANKLFSFSVSFLVSGAEGVQWLNRQILCPIIPFQCSAGKKRGSLLRASLITVRQRLIILSQEWSKLLTLKGWASSQHFAPIWHLASWAWRLSD